MQHRFVASDNRLQNRKKPDSDRGKLEFSKHVIVILIDNLVSRLVFKDLEAAVFRCGLMTLDSSQKRKSVSLFFLR